MTWQRRQNGISVHVWTESEQTDDRGNRVKVPVRRSDPVKVWAIPQRSAKAEVPGQAHINVMRIGIAEADAAGITVWSRVEMYGKDWDVVTPPALHRGTSHVRHFSLDLRERPS